MAQAKANKKLAKMISYMLGRSPGEFGLVPDEQGYVPIKEFLKALHEEEGWRHVRASQLREILLTMPAVPFELTETAIRATDRRWERGDGDATAWPPVLYTGIRRRAYPRVLEKGLAPGANNEVVLAVERDMARRMGQRRDAEPVILEVAVEKAERQGTVFRAADQGLVLADFIPPGCFSGPAVPADKPDTKKQSASGRKVKPEQKNRADQAGTFPLTVPEPPAPAKKTGKKKEPDWKQGRKRARRQKQDGWPDR